MIPELVILEMQERDAELLRGDIGAALRSTE